jgi:hypothetical protein
MSFFSKGRRIAEVGAGCALAAALVFTGFGCSGGSTDYPGTGTTTGGLTTTTGGTTAGGTTTAGTTTAGTTTAGTTTSGTTGSPGICANPPTPNYATPAPTGLWNHTVLKVYFNGDLSITTSATGASNPVSFKAALITGFNEWITPLNSTISFTQVSSSSGADIVVNFANSNTAGNSASWTANRSYTGSTLTGANATFTAQQTGGSVEPATLTLIGAQAFGALLGLNPSSSVTDITNANTSATAPSTDDINTVKALYCADF